MQVFEMRRSTFYTTDTPSFLPVLATFTIDHDISERARHISCTQLSNGELDNLSSSITVSTVSFFFFGLSLYLKDNSLTKANHWVLMWHVYFFNLILIKIRIWWQILTNIPNVKFHKYLSSGSCTTPCRWMDITRLSLFKQTVCKQNKTIPADTMLNFVCVIIHNCSLSVLTKIIWSRKN